MSNNIKVYKKGSVSFNYIDKSENIPREQIIGYINFKKAKDNEDSFNVRTANNSVVKYKVEKLKDVDSLPKKYIGYIEVTPEKYVMIYPEKKRNKILIILLAFLVSSILICGILKMNKINTPLDLLQKALDEMNITGDNKHDSVNEAEDMTTFPGYVNLFVSEEYPTIMLTNPKGNTVFMQYIIYENGVEIYNSNAISPGKMVKADLYSILSSGEHTLEFKMNTYDINTEIQCVGTTQTVDIMVQK